jgi:uncharacterized membrane protein YoaK (UPF0700 family)
MSRNRRRVPRYFSLLVGFLVGAASAILLEIFKLLS